MKKRVFVDGQHGTTGLQIRERLAERDDIEIAEIPESKRKEPTAREKMINEADIVFLCLPDDAARESVSLIKNPEVCVIDGSTAHRVSRGWVYGLPELKKDQRSLVKQSKRITVPGCHATGFILMLHPLVAGGIVPDDYPVTTYSIAGYSGGGRSMIADYDDPDSPEYIRNPRPYSLALKHKHIPEMTKYTGLAEPPVFTPTVVDVYKGEIISIPLVASHLQQKNSAESVRDFLAEYYTGEQFIKVMPFPADDYLVNGFLTFTDCNDTNIVEIFVFGDADRVLISARYDNLGKGSSGAAIQNMNIILGMPEAAGLEAAAVSP